MSKRKSSRSSTHFIQKILKLHRFLLQIVYHLLRKILVGSRRQRRHQQSGFVLPTTVLVLLVVSIVIAALIMRSLSRSAQVIGERQQQVIYNAASPAIDRAKAKLEYLFSSQGGLSSGIPPENTLISNLQNDQLYTLYTLPGETRLKLSSNSPSSGDNAWTYIDPATGNTIVYSILIATSATSGSSTASSTVGVTSTAQQKASSQVVRNAPFSTTQVNAGCTNIGGFALQGGWSPDSVNTSVLRKNFQVDAVVLNSNTVNQPAATLELVQERQLNQGNKWGAWFRNDLEIFPGPQFNWNGELHTEGSLFMGSSAIRTYLISSPNSCLYGTNGLANSEISMTQQQDSTGKITFQGQIISGAIKNNSPTSPSAVIDQSPNSNTQLTQTTDSVLDTVNYHGTNVSITPSMLALDPLTLFTADQSSSRNTNDPANTTVRDTANWDNSNSLAKGSTTQRVFNKSEVKPYVDDTYRADNRYGPKIPQGGFPNGKTVGASIATADPNYATLTSNTPPPNDSTILGLDGYWERRAHNQGLRIIVGQRLELGTPLPQPDNFSAFQTTTKNRPHEALQRRNLRDDVAAVQATAVYHYQQTNQYFPSNQNQDFPIACLATTVHPGTATTLQRSATFNTTTFYKASDPGTPSGNLISDFFNGWGTNGWEYGLPDPVNAFSPTSGPTTSLLNALNNLAYYAGDPFGGYPAQQDNASIPTYAVAAAGAVTHPYPLLTQSGDFSNLRRALNNLSASGYSSLSLADQSYLHTAACTLGMLAYQVKALADFDYTKNASNLSNLDGALKLVAYLPSPTNINSPQQAVSLLQNLPATLSSLTSTQKTALINNHILTSTQLTNLTSLNSTQQAQLVQLGSVVSAKEQVAWDRSNGVGYTCTIPTVYTSLNPKLCASGQNYHALYYIFPSSTSTNPNGHSEDRTDSYIANANPTAVAQPTLYKAINNTDLSNIQISPKVPSSWTLPHPTFPIPNGATTMSPNYSQNELISYTDANGNSNVYRVPFKDTALFNGRDMMNVRVLNIDLYLLCQNLPVTSPSAATDTLLPISGIVYAFREDAVREDGIARPAMGTWSNYTTAWSSNYTDGPSLNATGTTWRMNADYNPANLQDPPVNATTGISPKPIDYYPDPERRPYGFRLKNGSNLTRGVTASGLVYGLSFISDNPVYIQADSFNGFNLHQDSSGNRLEEFQGPSQYLASDWSNFYSRSTLDPNFARAGDSWLPTAILADAVSILSNNFCDGSIEDGFLRAGIPTSNTAPSVSRDKYGCTLGNNPGYTSYLDQNRPSTVVAATNWQRENPYDSNSPIAISKDGDPLTTGTPPTPYSGSYYNFSNLRLDESDGGNSQNKPNDSRINSIIVSGSVASRVGESYGGFHNFPRFLEDWNNVNLYISGSFIQLNFSSYATGPYDQDDWEPFQLVTTNTRTANEYIYYYSPPNRRWGYDVGLQYQPAGPVSQRFTASSNTRNEFYKEFPVDDPYIKLLRCAIPIGSSTQVDPKASCP